MDDTNIHFAKSTVHNCKTRVQYTRSNDNNTIILRQSIHQTFLYMYVRSRPRGTPSPPLTRASSSKRVLTFTEDPPSSCPLAPPPPRLPSPPSFSLMRPFLTPIDVGGGGMGMDMAGREDGSDLPTPSLRECPPLLRSLSSCL